MRAASSKNKTRKIDLYTLAEQLCEHFKGMAQDRGIWLINQCHGQLDAAPEPLRRARANLIINALRYEASNSPVVVSTEINPNSMSLWVHNHGTPIEAGHLPNLFERFYHCYASRHQPDDSGGLGLAIVRSVIHAHMSEVKIKSNVQETVFSLRPHLKTTKIPVTVST